MGRLYLMLVLLHAHAEGRNRNVVLGYCGGCLAFDVIAWFYCAVLKPGYSEGSTVPVSTAVAVVC